MPSDRVRLSSMAHGGGCGCKISPAILSSLLADMPKAQAFEQLLVGTETGDDAAVWQIDGQTCIISTTDFFMPMVDDPRDFGRIAATNAISDVYAMGGRPLTALNIACYPDKLDPEGLGLILRGGQERATAAGVAVVGGHTVMDKELKYGMAVTGVVHPNKIVTNAAASRCS